MGGTPRAVTYNQPRMRRWLPWILLLTCAPVHAELTCEQYGAIAEETVRQRDLGASLKRLLAELERGDMARLPAQERALLRDIVRYSFDGTLSPLQILEACKQGGTLVPR